MKIIHTSAKTRSKGQISDHFNPQMIAIILSLMLVTAVLVYFGIRTITQQGAHSAEVRLVVEDQRNAVESTRIEVNANLDALTQRMGLLQAHTNRLNALGDKLVLMANINAEEFNFLDNPALGGPQEPDQAGYESVQITKALDLLELKLLESEQKLSALDEILLNSELQNEIKPQGRPIVDGWMSSSYGYRNDPFSGHRQFHKGVDFAGAKGSPIFSVAGGIVAKAETKSGYGEFIEIDHGNGYVTRYGHSSKLHVKVGDIVKRGQHIADMGSTGRSTGPHVHFEVVKEGRHINPSAMIN